jgi:hypothetical protein
MKFLTLNVEGIMEIASSSGMVASSSSLSMAASQAAENFTVAMSGTPSPALSDIDRNHVMKYKYRSNNEEDVFRTKRSKDGVEMRKQKRYDEVSDTSRFRDRNVTIR